MKKILSVALSTAMAFSMFASVAFADTTVSTQDKFDALKVKGIFSGYPDGTAGLANDMTRAEFAKVITKVIGLKEVTGKYSYSDVGYNNAKNWAAPYIEAVTEAGVMQGQDLTKKLFNQKANVTVQELAEVLVKALKLEIPTTTDNTATEWAKGSVQAAINAGLLSKELNFQANATRSLLVEAAFAAEAALHPVVVPVTTATKVASASATNLKEVEVTFDGTVDKETAENKSNYSLKSGKTIDHVTLSADSKTATVYLTGKLTNNKVDAVSVSNVKAGTVVVSTSNVEFTTVDNVLPTVTSVKSLGTKSVKVVFSEPVASLTQTNFKLDGAAYYGNVTLGANDRSVILTPYSSTALAVGEHKLTVSGVNDAAGFVSLSSTHDITVVEDKVAPTITASSATLESVTLTFSEDVDTSSFTASDVFWKSGSTSYEADSYEVVADNEFKFYFTSGSTLPTGAVAIYATDFTDFSGNVIAADTSVVVTPVIDQTRPEVAKVEATGERTIQVKFNKAVSGGVTTTGNYTVTDADGDVVSVQSADLDSSDTSNKTILVTLYTDLDAGKNTITIKNIKDSTKLQNTMLDYTGTVTLGDTTAPTYSKIVTGSATRAVVTFSEKMDIATLTNYSNYLVTINGTTQVLNANMADISVLQDGKAVSITFAETINNKDVVFDTSITGAANVSALTVLAVKDLAGNYLSEFSAGGSANVIDLTSDVEVGLGVYNSDLSTKEAALTTTKTIKVKFTSPINSILTGAFTGVNGTIKNVEVDGSNVVTVNLTTSIGTDLAGLDASPLKVDLSKVITISGEPATSVSVVKTLTGAEINDIVKPVLADGPYGVVSNVITLKYSEALAATTSVDLDAADYKVTRVSDNTVLSPLTGYTVTRSGSEVKITLKDASGRTANTVYKVVVASAKNVKDVAGNVIADSSGVSASVAGAGTTAVAAAQLAVDNAQLAVTAATTADTNAKAAVTAATTADTNAKAAVTAAQAADTAAQATLVAAQAADTAASTPTTQADLAAATTDAAAKAAALVTATTDAAAKAAALVTATTDAAAKAAALVTAEATLVTAKAALAAL